MMHLGNRAIAPPGSFRFHSTELGKKAPQLAWFGPFHSFSDLMAEIRTRHKANSVNIPSEAEVEDWLCHALPDGHCLDSSNMPVLNNPNSSMNLTVQDVVEGTKVILAWAKNGFRRMPDDEVMRRAYVCNACPWHRSITGCQGCSGGALRGLIAKVVANNPLSTDALLQGCGVCKCSLVAKTRMPLDDIIPNMSPERKARLWEHCWILNPAPAQ